MNNLFPFYLSFKIATMATLLVVIFGTALGYLFAHYKFKGRTILEILLTLPLVLPPSVIGYYLILLLGRNGFMGSLFEGSIVFSWWGGVCAAFVVSLPLMVRSSKAAMMSVDKNLIQASYSLGNNKLKTAIKVILPLSYKGIAAGVVLSFTRALGEFGATLMVAGNIEGKTNTVPIQIYSMAESGDFAGANTMALIYLVIAFFLLAITRFVSKRSLR